MRKHGSESEIDASKDDPQPPRGGRTASGELAELTLAVYVEELATNKKVLFVGDPASPAPERLARVARSVEVVSARSRVRGTRRGGRVALRRFPTAEDAGRWDLVIVPDLAAAGLATADKVRTVARWLARGGVLVAGTPDPDGPYAHPGALAYEDLFDLLDPAFEHVRMLGQAPFAGFSVVDFAPPGDLGVTFDGSILEGAGERAQHYYALCGERDVVLDAYAVVQVPAAAMAQAREPSRARDESRDARVSELAERLREQQDALDAANLHAEETERELHRARRELEEARGELERVRSRLDAAQAEREAFEGRVRSLEAELAEAMRIERIDEEYAKLEEALHERGRELTELRAEVERRGTLVRDLVEELRELQGRAAALPSTEVETPAVAPAGEPTLEEAQRALRAQLDAAVERAVAAEAEKAQLAFQLDEVRGELALAERRASQELEELRRADAELRGTVRGLNARVAELAELHDLTQARLALAEDDRAAAEARNRRLLRELAEAREQLELEIARARVAESAREGGVSVDADELARLRAVAQAAAEREGRLLGELVKCREELAELAARREDGEPENARAALVELEQRIEGMRAGYEARVAELVHELAELGTDAERALVQAGELRSRLATREEAEAALRGELAGLRLRLADREAAVEALHEAALATSRELEDLRERAAQAGALRERVAELEEEASLRAAEIDTLRATAAELLETRRHAEALRKRVAELEAASAEREEALGRTAAELDEARARAAQLAASLEAARRAPATVEYARDTDVERRANRLEAMVSARDALVARLQRELADATERRMSLERRLDECATKLALTREELEAAKATAEVHRAESRREIDDLTARLERSEREHREALAGLEEARAILTELAGGLPTRRAEGERESEAVRHLRARIARLDAEAADREVLLRSLTAQLQERDDRIRALERMSSTGAESQEDVVALRQRLFEMEERIARLTDELEHERAARRRAENPPS